MNTGVTLERSRRYWAAVEPPKRDLPRAGKRHGRRGRRPQTLLGPQDAYCEARLFRESMFVRLVDEGGPIQKGKARALYRFYLKALDRDDRLAKTLGLSKRACKVRTVVQLLA